MRNFRRLIRMSDLRLQRKKKEEEEINFKDFFSYVDYDKGQAAVIWPKSKIEMVEGISDEYIIFFFFFFGKDLSSFLAGLDRFALIKKAYVVTDTGLTAQQIWQALFYSFSVDMHVSLCIFCLI